MSFLMIAGIIAAAGIVALVGGSVVDRFEQTKKLSIPLFLIGSGALALGALAAAVTTFIGG